MQNFPKGIREHEGDLRNYAQTAVNIKYILNRCSLSTITSLPELKEE